MSSASMLAMEGGASRSSDLPPARLERMFAEQHPLVWRTLRRLGLSPALAAEVARQVFLEAAKELGRVHRQEERTKLLELTVRQLGRAEMYGRAERRAHAQRAVPVRGASLASAPGSRGCVNGAASLDLMDQVLLRMSRPGVIAFILFELEGFAVVEVAEVLGMDAASALRALMDAREEFTLLVAGLREAARG